MIALRLIVLCVSINDLILSKPQGQLIALPNSNAVLNGMSSSSDDIRRRRRTSSAARQREPLLRHLGRLRRRPADVRRIAVDESGRRPVAVVVGELCQQLPEQLVLRRASAISAVAAAVGAARPRSLLVEVSLAAADRVEPGRLEGEATDEAVDEGRRCINGGRRRTRSTVGGARCLNALLILYIIINCR